MFDVQVLGMIAQLGLGLAGFSGIVLVLTRGGAEPTRLEKDRLGIMLGSSMGATFLALLPLVITTFQIDTAVACRVAGAIMTAYCAGFLRFYAQATLAMRSQAPELVTPLPFISVVAGHSVNIVLQIGSVAGLIACEPAYLVGLSWLLFHAAYQFGRILFIRPRSTSLGAAESPEAAASSRNASV